MPEPIEVVIVDDDRFFRRGLRAVLEEPGSPDIQLVAEAHDAGTALALVEEHVPDVLLADLKLRLDDPEFETGLTLIRRVRQISPHTQVLVLTAFDQSDLLLQALQAGANGYILKGDQIDGAKIRDGIASVARGIPFYSPWVMKRLHELIQHGPDAMPLEPLTPREQQVLALIAAGYTNQQIATTLVISIKTVKTHVSNILSKFQLKSRYQAALLYRTHYQ